MIASPDMRWLALAGISLSATMLAGCQTAATLTSMVSGRPLPRKVAQQMYHKDPAYYGSRYTPSGEALGASPGLASIPSSPADPAGSTVQTSHAAPASQGEHAGPARSKPRSLAGIPFEQLGQQYDNHPWIHPSEIIGGDSPQKLESFKEQARWISGDIEAAVAFQRFLEAHSINKPSMKDGDVRSLKDHQSPAGKRASGYEALGY